MRLFRVILPVPDIDEATAFYTFVLRVEGRRVSPGRHYFDCEGTLLACYDPAADGDEPEPHPRFHPSQFIYFATDDLDGALERTREAGGEILEDGIGDMPWGERMFWAHDPFGNPISFVERGTMFTGDEPPES